MNAKSKRPGKMGIARSASAAITRTRLARPAVSTLALTNHARKSLASRHVSRPRGGIDPAMRIAE